MIEGFIIAGKPNRQYVLVPVTCFLGVNVSPVKVIVFDLN